MGGRWKRAEIQGGINIDLSERLRRCRSVSPAVLPVLLSLLLLGACDVVTAQRSESQIFTVDYRSGADVPINMLDPDRQTSFGGWSLDNFSFDSMGIIHGSDLPESRYRLGTVLPSHRSATLRLAQNVTFPSSLIMSGVSRFWLRLPVGYDALNKSTMRLWLNNSITGQVFFLTPALLEGTIGPITIENRDVQHDRLVIELALPLYSGVPYTITFQSQILAGKQADIYACYGDLGRDGVMHSYWGYQYYDTVQGQIVEKIGQYVPVDLGYTFIFTEGLSRTGIGGVEITIPESGELFMSDYGTEWNLTAGPMTYHTIFPIGPAKNETLTYKIMVYVSGDGFPLTLVTTLLESWNSTHRGISFDYHVTANNSRFLYRIYPQNNQSQTAIATIRDHRGGVRQVAQTWTDSSQVYYYPMDVVSWRGSNFTSVPRGTRGFDVSSPFKVEAKGVQKLASAVSSAWTVLNVATPKGGNSDIVQEVIQEQIRNEIAIAIPNYPRTEPIINPREQAQLVLEQSLIGYLAVNGLPSTDTAAEYVADVGTQITDQVTEFVEELDPLGLVLDAVTALPAVLGDAFASVLTVGAEIVGAITKVIRVIISLIEVVLSMAVILASFAILLVFLALMVLPCEIILAIVTDDFNRILTILRFSRGGGT